MPRESKAGRQVGMRLAGTVVVCFLVLGLLLPPGTAQLSAGPNAQIVRDGYGVPHIYAEIPEDLFTAWGYVLAQDRLWQLEVSRASVWGRVAELYGEGPDGEYLEYDIVTRESYSTPDEVWQEVLALPAEYQALLEAFAAGINLEIEEALADPDEKLPYEFHQFEVTPESWTAADVAQVWMGMMANRFSDLTSEPINGRRYEYLVNHFGPEQGAAMFNDLLPLEVPDAPVTCPDDGAASSAPAAPSIRAVPAGIDRVADRDEARRALLMRVLARLGLATKLGSQMWVAGGSRTDGVQGLLLGGPQLSYTVPGILHEVGLHGAGFDLVGSTPAGFPVVLFGHNGMIAWSSTAGLGNCTDVFLLELEGDDYHYWYNGQLLEMEKRTETIQVRGEAPVSVDFYRSVYGPVFDWELGIAYTKKRAWEGLALSSWQAWLDATQATDFDAFSEAASSVSLSINWGYADGSDKIGYIHCGRYPIRHPDVDARLPTPGTGEYDWQGYHPFSWNPSCYDVAQGYLANWNNRPSVDYPIGDAPRGTWNTYHYVYWIQQELASRPQVTFDDMEDINRQIGFLDNDAAYLIPLFAGWIGGDLDPRQQEAMTRMMSWDKLLSDDDEDGLYDDPAATIWEPWKEQVVQDVLEDELGPYARISWANLNLVLHVLQGESSSVPLSWDYLNGVPADQVLQESLTEVLQALEAEYGTPNMGAWLMHAEAHPFSVKNANGIPQASVPVRKLRLWMTRGSENHIVALQPDSAVAVDVVPPGQSGFVHPDGTPSVHYDDQLDLFEDFYGYKSMLIPESIEGLSATNDSPTPLGGTTTLVATVAAGNGITYTWALGDGSYGNDPVVTHIYPAPGVYTAVVTATNLLGWQSTTTPVTILSLPYSVHLPLILRNH